MTELSVLFPKVKNRADLTPLNTFGIHSFANYLLEVSTPEDLRNISQIYKETTIKLLALGGGSNCLFLNDFEGLVLLNRFKGKEIISRNDRNVMIKINSGEIWDEFAEYCAEKGFWGIENLSLIPGTVGAAPIQNIGAYGQEVSQTIVEVEYFDFATSEFRTIPADECRFEYRKSIFKSELKNVFITSVVLRLSENPKPVLTYPGLSRYLSEHGVEPTLKNIRNAVIEIRRSKLPDYGNLGNAGSFFKNPAIDSDKFERLKKSYPELTGFRLPEGSVKISAGWLIEKAGWRGRREGDVGCYEKQALIIVNFGNASGEDIAAFSKKIQESVLSKFDIALEAEVNFIH